VDRDISSAKAASIEEIREEADGKLASIQQADALKEWQGHYDDLLGRKISKTKPSIPLASLQGDRRIKRVLKSFLRHIVSPVIRLNHWLGGMLIRLWPQSEGYIAQADQFKLWRNIWLFLLFASEATLTYLFTSVWHLNYKTQLWQILAYKLSAALLFGVLYASANKNYRIYSNLTDQVKHRSVVAKTIRGIILDENISDSQKDYKAELVAVGARAMFELKNTGHLTKKESAGPVIDSIRESIR
jgi:hypothetical protein